jgi:hypothetical protein
MALSQEGTPLSQEEFMALQFEGGGYEYVHGKLSRFNTGDGRKSEAWSEVLGQVYFHVKTLPDLFGW